MRSIFKAGERKSYLHRVTESDLPAFEGDPRRAGKNALHPVYSSYALARDAEWTCRLFVLEMLEDDEEGIGTAICFEHLSPALLGSEVRFEAEIEAIEGNRIRCRFSAYTDERLIARGTQEQAIVKKERLAALFRSLKNESTQ